MKLHVMSRNLLDTGLWPWKARAQGLQLSLVAWPSKFPSGLQGPPLENGGDKGKLSSSGRLAHRWDSFR